MTIKMTATEAKAKIYHRTQVSAVYNVEDPATRTMVEEADVVEGCRAIGFTIGRRRCAPIRRRVLR